MENQELKRQIENIRNLTAEGKIEDAVNALRNLSITIKDSATKDEIISISAKFKRLERSIRDQMVSVSDINLKQNQLTGQVLSLLSSLEKGYQTVATQTSVDSARPSSNQDPNTSFLKWLLPIAALLLLGGVGYYFFANPSPTTPVDNCADKLVEAQKAYIDENYKAAQRILENLPTTCRAKEEAQNLQQKLETKTTEPPPPIVVDDEDEKDEKQRERCNNIYKDAVLAYQNKDYAKAKSELLKIQQNCEANSQVNALLTKVEAAIAAAKETPVEESRELARFLLKFDKAYFIHSVEKGTSQLIANNPISYGQDWKVKKLKSFLFHVKRDAWKDFHWQVNTSRKEAHFIRNGTFGTMGGDKSKEKITVTPYPNGENPTRFQLFFDNFYMVHAPPSTTQVTAEGKVLQYGNLWEMKKISSNIYHMKSKAWKSNLFWKVDLATKKVEMFRGVSDFGKANAKANEYVKVDVEVIYK